MKDRITLSSEQIKCLNSGPRYEVFSALRLLEEASARDLAELTGRDAKSLYYHLRALEKAELVRQIEIRPTGRTKERVYAPTVRHVELNFELSDSHRADYLDKLMRLSMREARRSFDLPLTPEQRKQSTHLYRTLVRLSPKDLATFESMLTAAVDFAQQASNKDEGQRVSAIILVAPVGQSQ